MHEPQVGKEALKALRPAKDSDVDEFLAHLEEEPSSSTLPPPRSEGSSSSTLPPPRSEEDEYESLLRDVTSHTPHQVPAAAAAAAAEGPGAAANTTASRDESVQVSKGGGGGGRRDLQLAAHVRF
jgi:hypothetical protein